MAPIRSLALDNLSLDEIEQLPRLGCFTNASQVYRLSHDLVIKASSEGGLLHTEAIGTSLARQLTGIPQIPRVLDRRAYARGPPHSVTHCLLLEYKPGIPAEEAWEHWDAAERAAFAAQLARLHRRLRAHRAPRIMSLDHAFVGDDVFDGAWDYSNEKLLPGPFATEADFVRAVAHAVARRVGGDDPKLPLVHGLLQDLADGLGAAAAASSWGGGSGSSNGAAKKGAGAFRLTHGNLAGHVLVHDPAVTGEIGITGLLGWEQCGFYPGWWEKAKMIKGGAPWVDVAGSLPRGEDGLGETAAVATMASAWDLVY